MMDQIIENIILLLTNAFELYIIYRFMVVFFNNNFYSKQLVIIAFTVRYVAVTLVMIEFSYPILNIASNLISLFIVALCYKSTIIRKVLVTITIYMSIFLIEVVIAAVIGLSGFDFFEKVKLSSAFISIVMQILLWVITIIVERFKNVKLNISMPKSFVAAMVLVPTSSVFLEVQIFQQENISNAVATISLVFLLSTNFIMIYLFDSFSNLIKEKARAEVIEREKTYYHKQSELLQKSHEEVKQFRHDIKNKLLVIKQMAQKSEVEKIDAYISQISAKLDNAEVYSQSGNIVIDSIVNYKLNIAKEKGVKVQVNMVIPSQIEVEDDDIVVILGNLLDNAIEATERIQENKYIDVSIEYGRECLFITVENSFDNVIKMKDGKLKTRKNNEIAHGIGLESVRTTVEKYNGIIEFEQEKDKFRVMVMLYM